MRGGLQARPTSMAWDNTAAEFDRFAGMYDWMFRAEVFPHSTRPGDALLAPCREAIARVKPRRILDCACGPGWQAIELRQQGYAVHGADISPRMVALAKQHARESGLRIPFTIAGWSELPARVSGPYDFVMCHGNAIGHCHGKAAMVEAFLGMRAVAREGAWLYLDTRAWEWYRLNTRHYWPGATLDDADGHHTVLFGGVVPERWPAPHVIDTIHVVERDGDVCVDYYPVTFYAFKVDQLLECLRVSGFDHIETDYRAGQPRYTVLAQAA
jgi:glycine/sarcosine N-methyltransferase